MPRRLVPLLAVALLLTACAMPASPPLTGGERQYSAAGGPSATASPALPSPTALPPVDGGMEGGSPTATPIPPSPTPEPTATPIPPTDTPVPTAEPTKLSEADIPLEVNVYFNLFTPQVQAYNEGLNLMSAKMQDPQFGVTAWTLQLALGAAQMEAAYTTAKGIAAPAVLGPMHEAFLTAMATGVEASDQLLEAVDDRDADAIAGLTPLWALGGEQMETARGLFQEYVSQFDLD